jgi:ferredoxin-NADP reductase
LADERAATDADAAQRALRPVLEDHPRPDECDFYVAGPRAMADAAEFLLLEHGVPRAQLSVCALEA